MSSVSSFKPEDDSESEFEASVLRGLSSGRQTRSARSASRAASVAVASFTSDTPDPEDIDFGTDDTQSRLADLEARIQTLNPRALEKYSKFFEDEKGYFTFSKVDEDAEILSVTQHGAVIWTATEKEKFFNHLDRKGRNGIREIAAAIGTKSELEVMDYLNFLHEGLISYHHQSLQHDTVILSEVPPALEVSDSCRDELDKYADVLALKEEMDQSMVNRKRYGNNWVITNHQARKLVSNDSNEPLKGSIHLAAAILNVPNWIKLSRQIYMKFGGGREEDDWTNFIRTDYETPSMSGEALMDFYALALTITRRLIQSCIFLAMSRMRQSQQMGDEDLNPHIRTEDVKAAIDILNMKHTRGHFVFDAVRRNGLTVVDVRNEKGWKPQTLSYDEVEKILNGEDDDLHSENAHPQSEQDDQDDSEDEDYEEDEAAETHSQPSEPAQAEPEPPAPLEAEAGADDADDEEEDEDEAQDEDQDRQQQLEPEPGPPRENPPPEQDIKPDDDPQDPDFYPPTRRLSIQSFLSSGEEGQASDAEEEHAERFDREQSRLAEIKLWSLLQQQGPPKLYTPLFTEQQVKHDAENRPIVARKTKRELTGWRDLTLYHSEWEEYGSDAPDLVDELAENRRKRRRIEEAEALWEMGDDEDEDEQDGDESQGNDPSEDGGDGTEGPMFKSAEVVNSEESDVDQMDVDEVGHRASVPSKSPSIAVELPKVDPGARDAFTRPFPAVQPNAWNSRGL